MGWFNRWAFMKKLWCKLAISFILLTFCAMTLLMVLVYGLDDYEDFGTTLSLENIENHLASEKLDVAQAILHPDNIEWQDKVRHSLRHMLINLESGETNTFYRITNSSKPEVYMQITDKNDHLIMSDPADFPEKIAVQFAEQKKVPAEKDSVVWLNKKGPIWIDMPIADRNGVNIGRLRILYFAEFDLSVQLKSLLTFLSFVWIFVFLFSVPIGIACGLVASKYVTRHLQKMNEVTESWRQGKFDARIELPGDDVLVRHSQHLNDMARDLELFLSLKQNIAVSDERTRLARELHDTVKQKQFALGLQLATAKAKPINAHDHITEAEIINREAQQDLMEIITQLRFVGTNDTSLFERTNTIADDFRRRFDVNIELNHLDSVRDNAATEHHLLRIVQEALMNAVRHGKASKITITRKIVHDIATITITDNGSGFDTDERTQGFGITSMRDRVRDLPQGTFEIASTLGVGTKITISWKNEL